MQQPFVAGEALAAAQRPSRCRRSHIPVTIEGQCGPCRRAGFLHCVPQVAARAHRALRSVTFYADQLMLSSLGGWRSSRGHWNPPARAKPRPGFKVPNLGRNRRTHSASRPEPELLRTTRTTTAPPPDHHRASRRTLGGRGRSRVFHVRRIPYPDPDPRPCFPRSLRLDVGQSPSPRRAYCSNVAES
jgi:hypothetical protein